MGQPFTPFRVGRYVLHEPIAVGGMATVHFGRQVSDLGFARTVAIKRLHPHLANEPDFIAMLLDEARLAARIRHPNVVTTLDVTSESDEFFLVMDYVPGESLSRVLRAGLAQGTALPGPVVSAILSGVLRGLHAAHEARSEAAEPLHLVHRDVSPQNILVGTDGIPRVFDFGIAKASGRLSSTDEGRIKGKLAYMAPEQLRGAVVDRRVDIFAAGVVLWEALTQKRLFATDEEGGAASNLLERGDVPPPSSLRPSLPKTVDPIVLRALAYEPSRRFSTALQMAEALEECLGVASAATLSALLEELCSRELSLRARQLEAIEKHSATAPSLADVRSRAIGAEREAPLGVDGEATAAKVGVTVTTTPSDLPAMPTLRRLRPAAWVLAALLAVASAAVLATRWHPAPASRAILIDPAPPPAPAPPPTPSASTDAPEASAPAPPVAKPGRTRPPLRPPAPKPLAPSAAVQEYVGPDGVVQFCRPPNCPK